MEGRTGPPDRGCGPSLGKLLVDGKSNEIPAVTKLPRQLDVPVATVSFGAMGCQKKIAQEIHFTGGDHLLARKANHGPLHGEVAALFADAEAMEFGRTQGSQVDLHDPGPERGRGRISNTAS